MKKMRIDQFVTSLVSAGYVVMGMISIVIGIVSTDLTVIIQGCAFFALGTAYLVGNVELILKFKLDQIHGWFGPYENNVIDKRGFIFATMGFLANLYASILLYLSISGHLPVEYSNLAIGLIGLGLGLSSLGKTYVDNQKYDDIARGYNQLIEDYEKFSERLDKIGKMIERLNSNKEDQGTSGNNSITNV